MDGAVPAERLTATLDRIAAWRLDPDKPVACPICAAANFAIIDRSARPYSEWYALTCAACGLDTTLHIPMPGPAGGP